VVADMFKNLIHTYLMRTSTAYYCLKSVRNKFKIILLWLGKPIVADQKTNNC